MYFDDIAWQGSQNALTHQCPSVISPKNEFSVEVSKSLAPYTICWYFWAPSPVFCFLLPPKIRPYTLTAWYREHIFCKLYIIKRRGRQAVGYRCWVSSSRIINQMLFFILNENENKGRERSEGLSVWKEIVHKQQERKLSYSTSPSLLSHSKNGKQNEVLPSVIWER